MIELLPKMFLPGSRPSFYDGDSVTLLELAARLHGSMNEIISDYNAFSERVNQEIQEYMNTKDKDLKEFETALRQEFQDFIDTIDIKIKGIEETIKNNEGGKEALEALEASLLGSLEALEASLREESEDLETRVEIVENTLGSVIKNVTKFFGSSEYGPGIDVPEGALPSFYLHDTSFEYSTDGNGGGLITSNFTKLYCTNSSGMLLEMFDASPNTYYTMPEGTAHIEADIEENSPGYDAFVRLFDAKITFQVLGGYHGI